MCPGIQQLATRVENLNAVVLAVAHVDAILRVDRNRMRQTELARAVSLGTPRRYVVAGLVELDDAPVAVTVGDVSVALRVPRDVGWPIEGLRVIARLVLDAPGLQQ